MKKTTATAPSNIAFIKYWGKKDEKLRLPENGSISMCLDGLTTTTTVEFDEKYTKDAVTINGKKEHLEGSRVAKHLDRVRALAGISLRAKVVSKNNFPASTGLSSSASGFAALSVAASSAAELSLSEKDFSILARQGSGSACRSIPDGFVQWRDGDTSESSFSHSLHSPDYWDIADVVAIVSTGKKDVSTTEGQKLVCSSHFFPIRKKHIKEKIADCKSYLRRKDFTAFGELLEAEALELHAIMLTSSPALIYWSPGTLEIMKQVKRWRQEGLECYFTINTGQDIHVISRKKNVKQITSRLNKLTFVKNIIVNKPSKGARVVNEHLF